MGGGLTAGRHWSRVADEHQDVPDHAMTDQNPPPAAALSESTGLPRPKLSITYCTQCNWLLRSAWMAQEVLSTFSLEMGEVSLMPGTGGVFEIRLDGDLVWERKRDGGFPDVKALKQIVRDRIDPSRDLGHIDRVGR